MKIAGFDLVGIIVALAVGLLIGRFSASTKPSNLVHTPSTFDESARAYIDQKMGQSSGVSACKSMPQLMDRVAELEKKLGATEKLKLMRTEWKEKLDKLAASQKNVKANKVAKIKRQRTIEIKRLKSQIRQACATIQANTPEKSGAKAGDDDESTN